MLRRLGHTHADCVVWDVDDAQALLLLATLNRLEGDDDPRKRAAIVAELGSLACFDASALAQLLPEDAAGLAKLAALHLPPSPRDPAVADALPVAVTFFVPPPTKRALEARLAATGLPRDLALCRLLDLEIPPCPTTTTTT